MSLRNKNKKQQLDIKIRDFAEKDYPAIAKINNAIFPDKPITAEEYIEIDKYRNRKCKHRRWVAVSNGAVVGTGTYTQNIYQYHPAKFKMWAIVMPEYQNIGVGSKLYDQIDKSLKQFDPISVITEARDDMPHSIRFLQSRGYEEFQRYNEPYLEVELFDFTQYSSLESDLNSNGIQIKTMRELESDPERNRKLYELANNIGKDIPDGEGFTPIDYNFYKQEHIQSSHTLPDAYFVAVDNDKYVGLSVLVKYKEDKYPYTNLTGIIRSYRHRDIATCLKVKTIAYAKQNDYAKIRTGNMSDNQPMIQLNNKLGFKKEYDWLCFRKNFRNATE